MSEVDEMRRWSVALSGGGHRASLFALGALLYLVDSGVKKNVVSVVSVSGGSLTNGVLAQSAKPFDGMEHGEFLDSMESLLDRCAYKGTVQWAREAIAWAVLTFCLGLLVLGSAAGLIVRPDLPWIPDLGLNEGVRYAVLLLITFILFALSASSRSRVADRIFRRLLFTVEGRAVKLRATSERASCTQSEVRHIFCASELQSRLHAYFSPRFIYNYDFGVSTDFDLYLSTAVQASSNFPPAFPVRRLRTSKLGLSSHEGASRLLLTDGGVYDNMGEEWVTGAFDRTAEEKTRIDETLAGPPPTHLLVVNASKRDEFEKASPTSRLPLFGELGMLKSISDLMHQVTTTNRRSRLVDEFTARRKLAQLDHPDSATTQALEHAIGVPGALAHIATRCDWSLERYPTAQGRLGDINTKITEFNRANPGWLEEAHEKAQDLKTKLKKTGETEAAALIWQGYVLTMIPLYLDDPNRPLAFPTKDDVVKVLRRAKNGTRQEPKPPWIPDGGTQ